MMPGGYMVFWRGECLEWCYPEEVRTLTSTFVCIVDERARSVTLV